MHRDHRFLIDCGEGTQRQILRSGLGFKRLQKILITHGHLDHILGLGGLLSTLTRWEAIEHVEIWAGQRALRRIRDLVFGVVFRGEREQLRIEFKEIVPGAIIADGNSFELMAFPVTHRGGQCFGFVFQEKPRRPFLEEKAVELGVPNGPERRDLVQGRTITLPEGKIVHPDDVLGPVEAGTKLVHVGDAGETDDILEHCRDADALVVEATYLHSELDLARRFGHLTALQAAELAQAANVRSLYLTHLSRRYRERDVTAEAQSVFANTVVARDLDHIEVRR
jgi:ribonuclease Z